MRMTCCALFFVLTASASTLQAETGCFRTAHEAAYGAGVRDGFGFRLEGVRVDRMSGANWATVRSCEHPERPGQVLAVHAMSSATPATLQESAAAKAISAIPAIVIRANDDVTVVHTDGMVRMELAGVAQENKGAGQQIRVRIGPVGQENIVTATVRAQGLVELEDGR